MNVRVLCSMDMPKKPTRQTHVGNPCYDLQGFPMELTPIVTPCCIDRNLEECSVGPSIAYSSTGMEPSEMFVHTFHLLNDISKRGWAPRVLLKGCLQRGHK